MRRLAIYSILEGIWSGLNTIETLGKVRSTIGWWQWPESKWRDFNSLPKLNCQYRLQSCAKMHKILGRITPANHAKGSQERR
jgi:hypothetical protein